MRLFLDLQPVQGASGRRGIGRYSFELAKAIVRNADAEEIWLGLNDRLPVPWASINAIRGDRIPMDRVAVFSVNPGIAEAGARNLGPTRVAEAIRESFIARLRPDVVHVSSLFEGFVDDVAVSIGENAPPTAVTLYDLIPLLRPETYLQNAAHRAWYERRLVSLRRAGRLLAISESAKGEAVDHLGIDPSRIAVIHAGVNESFRPVAIGADRRARLATRYGVAGPFLLYMAHTDARKNLAGLIDGFGALPPDIRDPRQLMIVTPIDAKLSAGLHARAATHGIRAEQLLLPGHVPEEDLNLLYSACELFVFPSLHEGFGLPILEAMACGAPVIGSATSSMPEALGSADALFDPTSPASIAGKIVEAVTSPRLREALKATGARQVARFTWDSSAAAALAAFRSIPALPAPTPRRERLRLAYFSPLAPQRSGISEYSAEVLPALAAHYEIDLILDQPEVAPEVRALGLPIRDVAWFEANAGAFARIVYNFGNSPYHEYMLGLIDRWPGVVILHDFYLSSLVHYLSSRPGDPDWANRLHASHGLAPVRKYRGPDPEAASLLPTNLGAVENALGVLVHSEHAVDLARKWLGHRAATSFRKVAFARATPKAGGREEARRRLGHAPDDIVVASFGHVADVKLAHRLVRAWKNSPLAADPNCHLVFVGNLSPGNPYDKVLRDEIGDSRRIRITGYVDLAAYRDHLAAGDVAVQLRTSSRGETSASALDCLAAGLPLVVNTHGSMAELPDSIVVKIADDFSDGELGDAILGLAGNPDRRRALGAAARHYAEASHDPRGAATEIRDAVDDLTANSPNGRLSRLVATAGAIAKREPFPLGPAAAAMAANRQPSRPPNLLLDVTIVSRTDRWTGVERVARNLMDHLSSDIDQKSRAELVTAVDEIRYARAFAASHFGIPPLAGGDAPVDFAEGDTFVGLDFNATITARVLERLRQRRVKLAFVLYDLLPVTDPRYFIPSVPPLHTGWLRLVAEYADIVACISEAVADEFRRWLPTAGVVRIAPLHIASFPLGADLPATPVADAPPPVDPARAAQSVLMVGTIEPRKGHAQALDAFERLWARGSDLSLIIVGKAGWLVEPLVERLRRHPESGKRLFWLEGLGDAPLLGLYRGAGVLLAASHAEGFGLPLIEAAHHGLPILARDIPVFREVAGSHATYFAGDADSLAGAIAAWFAARDRGEAPASEGLRVHSWAESAAALRALVEGAPDARGA